MRLFYCTIALACVALSAPCRAMSLTRYLETKDTTLTHAYILGIGEGYSWANVKLEHRGEKPFYCVPLKLAMNDQTYIDILDAMFKAHEEQFKKMDTPPEYILFAGLQDTFPCPDGTSSTS